MTAQPFHASQFSDTTRKFLFACAFWLMAADEELTSAEQEWLSGQLGADAVALLLQEFISLDSAGFFATFDSLTASLPPSESRVVFAGLERWMQAATSGPSAEDVIPQILGRIGIQNVAAADGSAAIQILSKTTLAGCGGEILHVVFSRDGRRILAASEDGTVRAWNLETAHEELCLGDHGMGATAVIEADGGNILTSDRLGRVICHGPDGSARWTNSGRRRGGVSALAAHPDGKTVAAVTDVGMILLIDVASGRTLATWEDRGAGSILAAAFLPDCTLLTGGDDRRLRAWETPSGRHVRSLDGHADGITGIGVTPDGRSAVTSSRDNTVRLWDLSAGTCPLVLKGHSFSVMDAAIHPSRRWGLSASWDHTFRAWDLSSGTSSVLLELNERRFAAAAFAPGTLRAAAGDSSGTVHILELAEPAGYAPSQPGVS